MERNCRDGVLARARRDFYVGESPRHSTNIGRVLNLQTGHISDQFHCVYDDHYSTVLCPEGNPFETASFSLEKWNRILESGYERHVDIEVDKRGHPIVLRALDDDWLTGPERQLRALIRRQRTERRMEQLHANGSACAQREHPLQREPAPSPARFQREPAQQLLELPNAQPDPTRVERDHRNNDDDNSIPGLLGQDDVDSDAESDNDQEERDFYHQRSGREVEIGENDGFGRTKSGRRVIPPDRLGAHPAYRDIGFPGENMGAYQCGREPAQKI
jgi:hypothetical protein